MQIEKKMNRLCDLVYAILLEAREPVTCRILGYHAHLETKTCMHVLIILRRDGKADYKGPRGYSRLWYPTGFETQARSLVAMRLPSSEE